MATQGERSATLKTDVEWTGAKPLATLDTGKKEEIQEKISMLRPKSEHRSGLSGAVPRETLGETFLLSRGTHNPTKPKVEGDKSGVTIRKEEVDSLAVRIAPLLVSEESMMVDEDKYRGTTEGGQPVCPTSPSLETISGTEHLAAADRMYISHGDFGSDNNLVVSSSPTKFQPQIENESLASGSKKHVNGERAVDTSGATRVYGLERDMGPSGLERDMQLLGELTAAATETRVTATEGGVHMQPIGRDDPDRVDPEISIDSEDRVDHQSLHHQPATPALSAEESGVPLSCRRFRFCADDAKDARPGLDSTFQSMVKDPEIMRAVFLSEEGLAALKKWGNIPRNPTRGCSRLSTSSLNTSASPIAGGEKKRIPLTGTIARQVDDIADRLSRLFVVTTARDGG